MYVVIDPQYKKSFYDTLFNLYPLDIEAIYETDIVFDALNNRLLSALCQEFANNNKLTGILIKIECNLFSSVWKIFHFLKDNIQRKGYLAVGSELSLEYMLTMELFLSYSCREIQHPSTDISIKVKFLKKIEQQTNNISPSIYFTSVGLYLYTNGRIKRLPQIKQSDRILQMLPIIALDIETSMHSMLDIPLGISADEKVVTIVLRLHYIKQLKFNVILYLRPFIDANDYGTFEANFNRKYNRDNIPLYIKGFNTEIDLLRAFLKWYSHGQLFHIIHLSKSYPHFLIGHNICIRL